MLNHIQRLEKGTCVTDTAPTCKKSRVVTNGGVTCYDAIGEVPVYDVLGEGTAHIPYTQRHSSQETNQAEGETHGQQYSKRTCNKGQKYSKRTCNKGKVSIANGPVTKARRIANGPVTKASSTANGPVTKASSIANGPVTKAKSV